ncbi:glycosyltransferase family 2 protein [Paraburkholderia bannensis]|uniref:glycosyltransferase family 2 protein n=1 Tax=Paraburkholderia bannensis TaxID=765414 RepID=UPI002AB77CBE|nr:glycosyltransferase [Paraburkholderia bannensis]
MLGKLTRGAQQQGQYARWIAEHDSPSADEMGRFARLARNLPRTPLISVVVPAYNTPASCLTEMIESVLAQVYPHWELCIANDASTAPHVREILDTYAQRDARVRVHHRQQNGHICAASNSALELATGEFVALLDHDDLLAPQALAMVVKYLNDHPHARLFYSDEDKVSSDGRRITPYFKAGWDPELILQRNVFSHLGVYETALVREVGGFRVGFEGSQDHDLVLRSVGVAGDAAVVHIPHVLYHWRAIDGSTAVRAGEKPYAVDAGLRAVREALAASTPQAEALEPTLQRPFVQVRYPLPEPAPTVQLLVRCSDRDAPPEALLRAIFARTPGLLAHVTLVGRDAVAMVQRVQALAGARRADIVLDAQPGLAAALSASEAACVCLLDAYIDTFDEGWLEALVRHAMRPEIGLVGPRLGRVGGAWFQAGLVAVAGNCALAARSGATREDFGYFGVNQLTRSVTALPLDCVVARRAVLADFAALVDTQDAGAELRLARALSERGLRHVVVAGTIVQSGKAGQEAATAGQSGESALLDRAYSPHLELAARAATFEIAATPRIGQFD